MNEQRGGYRKHAGRPVGTTKPDKRQSLTIRLPPDLIELLRQMPKQGRFIEAAIRQKLGDKNMNIQREALNGGEIYICKDCGHVAEENSYPTNHTGTSARKLWDNDREQAIKEGIFFSGYKPCDCDGE